MLNDESRNTPPYYHMHNHLTTIFVTSRKWYNKKGRPSGQPPAHLKVSTMAFTFALFAIRSACLSVQTAIIPSAYCGCSLYSFPLL